MFTLLWINPTEPQWLYEKGVPRVEIDTFKSDPNFAVQAYPLDAKYKFYSERIITKLAEHLRRLPPELLARVAFHQVVEGSTGDGFCYKGEPKDPRYAVTREPELVRQLDAPGWLGGKTARARRGPVRHPRKRARTEPPPGL